MGYRSRLAVYLFSLSTIFVVAPSSADVVCEKGQIRALSIEPVPAPRSTTLMMVSTGMPQTPDKDKILNLAATSIQMSSSGDYKKWREKYAMLKTAFADGSYIVIVRKGPTCAAWENSFTITVCPTSEDCTE
ncbi:hypothetical protein [Tahibacter soli]|uniref:Secreted protein n=1 Tax=Tahibacter soli TaxID=2983605 RepID=A0A9X3YN72_9GAMM|nr:hypothetical protein [Tahibacter soli]MDC8015471.1 hypothetical protein [Tahibacter soli]